MNTLLMIGQNQEKDVEILAQDLKRFGINLKLVKCEEIDFISITTPQSNPRNAGRKPKYLTKTTIEDIKKDLETQTAEQVAKSYGVSRATLFRRLKESKKSTPED